MEEKHPDCASWHSSNVPSHGFLESPLMEEKKSKEICDEDNGSGAKWFLLPGIVGRDKEYALCFFVGIICGILLGYLYSKTGHDKDLWGTELVSITHPKTCCWCKESIKKSALICKHCGIKVIDWELESRVAQSLTLDSSTNLLLAVGNAPPVR